MNHIELSRKTRPTDYVGGMEFVRAAIAKAVGGGTPAEQETFARSRWDAPSRIVATIKAATGASDPSSILVTPGAAGPEFFQAVREASVVGRIASLRRVPLNCHILRQTKPATAAFVGAAQGVPVIAAGFSSLTLPPLKVAAITVQTLELLRVADPVSELGIRNDLIAAAADALDVSFLSSTNAGTTDVEPASVTHGMTAIPTTGDLHIDLVNLVENFSGDLTRAVFVAKPETFIKFCGANNPNLGALGGRLLGLPALATRKAEDGVLVLLDGGDIAAGFGDVELTTTQQASHRNGRRAKRRWCSWYRREISVSMWQANCTAIKVLLWCNWAAGAASATLLTGLNATGT